ncbi:MAG: metallophosphoesterase [Bryobacteraceae bacterium]
MYPSELHEFDELYAVSDLHLGGEDRFPIFTEAAGKAFRAFCERIGKTTKRTAFVVNGDLVDFLAEKDARYFDPSSAADKLGRIAGDRAFKPVFEGLSAITASPHCHMAITIGNHDIELALPWVQEKLVSLVAASAEARARVTLSLDGTGYRCKVGGTRVVCIHGNDVDYWNLNDYEAIRRAKRRRNFGAAPLEWVPNAGTKLVVDVMNQLKREYSFVNLLKPEIPAVVPILVALDPAIEGLARSAAQIAGKLAWDFSRHKADLLGETPTLRSEPDEALLAMHQAAQPFQSQRSAAEILTETERRFEEQVDPYSLASDADEQLGYIRSAYEWFRGNPSEAAREALERLAGEKSFEMGHEDAQAKALDQLIGAGASVVIAGHTHLERSHGRKDGGWYLNSGTWTQLMRVEKKHWETSKGFEPLWVAITRGSPDALKNFVKETRTIAAVRSSGRGVTAALLHIDDAGAETVVAGSSQRVAG